MIRITMTSFIRLFSLILVLFIIGCVQKEDKQKKPTTRPPNAVKAPDFTLVSLEGDMFTLSDLRGNVILLNFWATWCYPCKIEIPDLNKLQEKYQDKGFDVVGITLTSGSPGQISKFAEEWGMNYKVLTDIEGNETEIVTNTYGQATGAPISGVPTSFIIDRDGYIVKTYIGPRSEQMFYNDLKHYL